MAKIKSADAANIGARTLKGKLQSYFTSRLTLLQAPFEQPGSERAAQTEKSHVTTPQIVDSRLALNVNRRNPQNRKSEFEFTELGELLKEPEEQVAYVWERAFPCGGFSICAAKPKVGKSTFARNLAVAVTRGSDFCGRGTAKGKVIYLCLEEKRAEVAAHFRRMGADDADILIHTGPTPEDVLSALAKAIATIKPILVDFASLNWPTSMV